MGLSDNDVLINPTRKEIQSSALDLIVTATKQNMIVMLEGKGNVVDLTVMLKAIKKGTKECQNIINAINKVQQDHGKPKQIVEPSTSVNEELSDAVKSMCEMRLREIFRDHTHDKISRDKAVNVIREEVVNKVWSSYPNVEAALIQELFNEHCKLVFRDIIFENERCDGRTHEQLRNISCQVDLYKPLHGSALFQRGQTQVLSTISLDSLESAIKLDTLSAIDM